MGNLQAANRAALYQVPNNQQTNNCPASAAVSRRSSANQQSARRQESGGEISSPLQVLQYDQANDGYIPGRGKNISTYTIFVHCTRNCWHAMLFFTSATTLCC